MAKTTQKQFKEFKRWCGYYRDIFGLMDWQVYVGMKPLKPANTTATVDTDVAARTAAVLLNDRPTRPHDAISMRETACHEMFHVLLTEFNCLARYRHATEDELEIINERNVVQLTNIIRKLEDF